MAAIYQATLYCDDCADVIRERIWLASAWGSTYTDRKSWEEAIGYNDESLYDSDDFPKYCDDDEESNTPDHCASGAECINAQELASGFKVGYFFGNALNSKGAEYVKDAVREDTEVGHHGSIACTVWMPFYNWIDYEAV
jgi:hypothetical protein